MSARPVELVAFVGPSLPRAQALAEVRRAAPVSLRLLGPARQGDVWRALRLRPRAIALIDGVFESSPSVWHHELLDALDGGVLLFGAASMGALRAAELRGQGMIGVGRIFARYRDGLDDDAAVALLHADADHGFRPLSVPLVNAEHAIAQAAAARALGRGHAATLLAAARALGYQERSWPAILDGARLSAAARARWDAFAAGGLPDLKADDARLCLREAARAAAAQRTAGARRPPLPRARPPSALVRARRALDALAASGPRPRSPAQRAEDTRAGTRTLLLAGLARTAGLRPTAAELGQAREHLLRGLGAGAARERALARLGLAEDELQRLAETLALEQLALAHAARLLPDGPSVVEGERAGALLSSCLSDPGPAPDPGSRRHRRGFKGGA